jgi:hypothetical protein
MREGMKQKHWFFEKKIDKALARQAKKKKREREREKTQITKSELKERITLPVFPPILLAHVSCTKEFHHDISIYSYSIIHTNTYVCTHTHTHTHIFFIHSLVDGHLG